MIFSEKSFEKVDYTNSNEVVKAFVDLNFDTIDSAVNKLLAKGSDPWQILEDCRIGMNAVGELYSSGEYYLGELVMAAEIFEKIVTGLEKEILSGQEKESGLGHVVIGTPIGDIHDIGKNIVATVFRAAGFKVHDLGVDVSPEDFVKKVEETDAKIIAMSALITPTFQGMKDVVDLLIDKGLRKDRYVIIGGGPTTITVQNYVGADGWTLDPKEGAELCKRFVEKSD